MEAPSDNKEPPRPAEEMKVSEDVRSSTAIGSQIPRVDVPAALHAVLPAPRVDIALRPDPMTLIVELRNTTADRPVMAGAKPRGPIAGVTVEPAEAGGVPVSRVRIALTQPVAHRIRNVKSFVIVDFDKAPDAAAVLLTPSAARAAADAEPPAPPPPPPARPTRTTVDPIEALRYE